jgi:hypothetical protein
MLCSLTVVINAGPADILPGVLQLLEQLLQRDHPMKIFRILWIFWGSLIFHEGGILYRRWLLVLSAVLEQ